MFKNIILIFLFLIFLLGLIVAEAVDYTQACNAAENCPTLDCSCLCSYSCPSPQTNSYVVSNTCTPSGECICTGATTCSLISSTCSVSGVCSYSCNSGYVWNGTNCTYTSPSYSSNSTNSTLAGTSIQFRLKWQSETSLSKAILSIWNGSAPWVNITPWCSLSGTSDWCNVTTVVNSTVGATIWWNQYANDSANNWTTSENFSFVTSIPPNYTSNSTNSTIAGLAIEHRLRWMDEAGLSGYIFSFDNCTGSFVNNTFVSFSGTANWSNVTKTVNTTTNCIIRWQVYANDTSNNWNASLIYSYTTTDTRSPQYSDITVSPASGTTYSVSQIYTFQSVWTENVAINDVILEFVGANYSYLVGQLSKIGNTYSKSFVGLEVGTHNYKWFANDTSNNWNSTSIYAYQVIAQTIPPTSAPQQTPSSPSQSPETYQPPENPTEFPETIIELPQLPTLGTPITLPTTGLTIRLEPNFVISLYPLTNKTAIVHNLSKIEEPGKYKILLCNQTLISSYEINITADLAYYCANYSGYPFEEPTVNIFKFRQNNWIPLPTGNIIRNTTTKIICGKIESTPYMISGFQPTVTSETAMIAINDVKNTIILARKQNINVTEATVLMNKALYEYYSCNYMTAKTLAEEALASLVGLKIPEWILYLGFALIIITVIWYYKIVRSLKRKV